MKKKANHLGDAKVDGVGIAFKGRGESLGPSKIFRLECVKIVCINCKIFYMNCKNMSMIQSANPFVVRKLCLSVINLQDKEHAVVIIPNFFASRVLIISGAFKALLEN